MRDTQPPDDVIHADSPRPRGILVDLHCHSRYSDGTATIEQIEDECRRQQIGLALTDHNEIHGSIRLFERGRVAVVPALEVGTREGLEFLVYFQDPEPLETFYVREVEPYLMNRFMVRTKVRSLAALEGAHELGGYVSLAHPFAPGRKSVDFHRRKGPEASRFVDRVLSSVNAIELFNGGILRRSNRKADNLTGMMSKPVTAGSDSHHLSTLGSCGIRYATAPEPDGSELFHALAANQGLEIITKQGQHLRSVPIIAVKHTIFFLQGRKKETRPK